MDTQIGDGPDVKDEWAVDVIRSHAGSGESAVFEIIWKLGDTTWMPLYQIKHLHALEAYLELMGINDALALPVGTGKPPQEDPQIFLGALTISPLFSDLSRHPPSITSFPIRQTSLTTFCLFYFQDIFEDDLYSLKSFYLSSTTYLHTRFFTLNLTSAPSDIIMANSIRHPQFVRLDKTKYAVYGPASPYCWSLHVHQ